MRWSSIFAVVMGLGAISCGREEAKVRPTPSPALAAITVKDTVIPSILDATGTAEPVQRATLSTKLMGTVTAVLVREGDRVRRGQPLVTIDQRDIDAKAGQASAAVSAAEAVRADAEVQAKRMRSLFADSAATRAQLDAAETGLARAVAGAQQARAAAAELTAVAGYARITAPFDGVVTRRFVDPGAFAAPGAPLVSVEDGSRLRVAVSAAPQAVRTLRRGDRLAAAIESRPADATVEGVVPVAGAVYTVNAIVDNAAGQFLPGSAASLALPQGSRHALLVPESAVVRQGDLAGVRVRSGAVAELRWVRLGARLGGSVEVLSGLRPGDQVLLDRALAETR